MDSTISDFWHLVVEFVALDLDDDQVIDDLLADPTLRIMWSSVDGVTTAEADIAAETFDEALDIVIDTVAAAAPGAQILRLVDPLVTVSDIADEAGVTRQAVRNWALGQRHSGFPRPLDVVGDGVRIWRLADVDRWLTETLALGSGRRFPSIRSIAATNETLDDDTDDGWTVSYVIAEEQAERIEPEADVSTSTPDLAEPRAR